MIPPRLILVAAVLAGVSYIASWNLPLPDWAATAWKGSGVALLAVYAAMTAERLDGRILAAVLAFGALGDVLLETHGLTTGALAFLAGHATAVWLYIRNRRTVSGADRLIAVAVFAVTVIVAYAVTADPAAAPLIATYAAGLGAMAATAWLCRFPRNLTALGALMFVASDLLIFVRTGRPALGGFSMGLGVWGLYFGGQLLVCLGGLRGLRIR